MCTPIMSVLNLQVRLGRYCEILWDRHGGNWIGLRWRKIVLDSKTTKAELVFSRTLLDGLVMHKPSADGSQMLVVHKLSRLMHLLPVMFQETVENVNDLRSSRLSEQKQKQPPKNPTVVISP